VEGNSIGHNARLLACEIIKQVHEPFCNPSKLISPSELPRVKTKVSVIGYQTTLNAAIPMGPGIQLYTMTLPGLSLAN